MTYQRVVTLAGTKGRILLDQVRNVDKVRLGQADGSGFTEDSQRGLVHAADKSAEPKAHGNGLSVAVEIYGHGEGHAAPAARRRY